MKISLRGSSSMDKSVPLSSPTRCEIKEFSLKLMSGEKWIFLINNVKTGIWKLKSVMRNPNFTNRDRVWCSLVDLGQQNLTKHIFSYDFAVFKNACSQWDKTHRETTRTKPEKLKPHNKKSQHETKCGSTPPPKLTVLALPLGVSSHKLRVLILKLRLYKFGIYILSKTYFI